MKQDRFPPSASVATQQVARELCAFGEPLSEVIAGKVQPTDAVAHLARRLAAMPGVGLRKSAAHSQLSVTFHEDLLGQNVSAEMEERLNSEPGNLIRMVSWNGETVLFISETSRETGLAEAERIADCIARHWRELRAAIHAH